MRTSHTLSYLNGFHRGTTGTTLIDTGQKFLTRGVTTSSTLKNLDSGQEDTVTSVAETELVAGTLQFKNGDLYEVSLPTAWTVQNDDMISWDVECRLCGFSFPRKQLVDGKYCRECVDED